MIMVSLIKDLYAREILDSRGNPTIETELLLDNGMKVVASVPSGASTGSREALELRDNDNDRYMGKGVLTAVDNVNTIIRDALIGMELNQASIDKKLLELDGTENKERLGANAILSVSLACLKAQALTEGKELFEYVTTGKVSMPIPMINILNGGVHAKNGLNIQEFMIIPVVSSMQKRVQAASEIFHHLQKILAKGSLSTGVGDEGGFAPNLKKTTEAFDYIVKAIKKAGYEPGIDVFIGIDCAASEFYDKETKKYKLDGNEYTVAELINFYLEIVDKYPIISIEDPFYEDDFDSLAKLTKKIGDKVMLVGDDYFVTNEKYLQKGIKMKAGNAILLKANQIGTMTEMLRTIVIAKQNNYKTIISHRSGETEDTFIADLAVGLNLGFIKTGSMCRGERICKYNRLLKIEELILNGDKHEKDS